MNYVKGLTFFMASLVMICCNDNNNFNKLSITYDQIDSIKFYIRQYKVYAAKLNGPIYSREYNYGYFPIDHLIQIKDYNGNISSLKELDSLDNKDLSGLKSVIKRLSLMHITGCEYYGNGQVDFLVFDYGPLPNGPLVSAYEYRYISEFKDTVLSTDFFLGFFDVLDSKNGLYLLRLGRRY